MMLFVTVTITVPQKQSFPSLSTTSIVFAGELKLFRASNTSVWCSDFVNFFFIFYFFPSSNWHSWLFYFLLLPPGHGATGKMSLLRGVFGRAGEAEIRTGDGGHVIPVL